MLHELSYLPKTQLTRLYSGEQETSFTCVKKDVLGAMVMVASVHWALLSYSRQLRMGLREASQHGEPL